MSIISHKTAFYEAEEVFQSSDMMLSLAWAFLTFHISTKPLVKRPSKIPGSLCRCSCLQMIAISCLQSPGLMPMPCTPVIKLASWYFHYRFLATKRRGTFLNASNPRSSPGRPFRRTLPKWMSGSVVSAPAISGSNTKYFFLLHGESIINMIFLSEKSLKSLLFFFLGIYFCSHTTLCHPKI